MADERNPYAPPAARVADPDFKENDTDDVLIANGRITPFTHGARWLTDARKMFGKRPGKWIVTTLIFIVLIVGVGRIPFVGLLAGILTPLLAAGVCQAADQQRRSGDFRIETMFRGFGDDRGPLLLVGCVHVAMVAVLFTIMAVVVGSDVAVGLLVTKSMTGIGAGLLMSAKYLLAWLIYLAIAVPVGAATYFSAPLITLNKLAVAQALKMSFIGSFKNVLPSLLYSLCALFFIFLSAIPLGLGLFVSLPILLVSFYTSYRDIFIEKR